MQIKLIYVGEASHIYKDAVAEYEKRLSPFCAFESVCVKEAKIDDRNGAGNAEIKKALDLEAERIAAHVPQSSFKIALCIEGRMIDSREFSMMLGGLPQRGVSKTVFIIGSSHGLSDSIKNACDFKLSMSEMTFPHQLARLMLTEQIYRAFSISSGSKYHK